VLSFSSEDVAQPAQNLLKSETYRKWRCATAGEKQASVILEVDFYAKNNVEFNIYCTFYMEELRLIRKLIIPLSFQPEANLRAFCFSFCSGKLPLEQL